ncbi:hypothetical protein H4R21_006559, partial [Coemansia helicoidea]
GVAGHTVPIRSGRHCRVRELFARGDEVLPRSPPPVSGAHRVRVCRPRPLRPRAER